MDRAYLSRSLLVMVEVLYLTMLPLQVGRLGRPFRGASSTNLPQQALPQLYKLNTATVCIKFQYPIAVKI